MSVSAMAWVFEQDIRPSSIKFVLLALADCASRGNGEVWLAISSICEKTSQDRKTVIAGLDLLEKLHLLEDTGRRVGSTNQVKVYRIVGLPSSVTHYTYTLTDPEGNYYIGVRSCSGEAENDDKYMGSGKWPSTAKNLKKKIIMKFATRVEAEAAEVRSIRAASNDPKCQNSQRFRNRNCSESGEEESRKRTERVPETGHGTVKEPKEEPKPSTGMLFQSDPENQALAGQEGFVEEWRAFRLHRRKLRVPMTERAEELILETLAERPKDAVDALRVAQKKGWRGFEWEWYDKAKRRESSGGREPRERVDYKSLTKDTAV